MNKEEHDEYHKRLFYVLSIMVFLFFGGSFFYSKVEGWRMLDAMYFSATTMTTVGYGDISPKTDLGRLFTIFYLFASVGIAVYGLSLFAAHFVEVREDHWVERLDKVSIKKHTKNFHDTVKKLFVWDSKDLVEHDKLKKE
jgi:voltage-gated potassium channel